LFAAKRRPDYDLWVSVRSQQQPASIIHIELRRAEELKPML